MKIGSKARGLPSSNFGLWIADFRFADFVGRFCETPSCLAGVWHRRQANATICQILAAIADLARRDLRRLDQRHVRRAYVTIHRSLLALVETRHVARSNLDNSGR